MHVTFGPDPASGQQSVIPDVRSYIDDNGTWFQQTRNDAARQRLMIEKVEIFEINRVQLTRNVETIRAAPHRKTLVFKNVACQGLEEPVTMDGRKMALDR